MAKEITLPKETPIPSNWQWIELGKLASTKSGFPFDSKRFTAAASDSTRPLIRIRDVVRGYTETFTDEDCPDDYIIRKGEILIGMDGDFNTQKWDSEEALLNQRVCCIKSVSDLLVEDFMYYYLPTPLKAINDATPSVTVKHLSTKTISKIPIPLPPFPEQQRIVERIESLFAQLDEAKEKAQAALDSFEPRKAAILHKAFTGELTAKWRDEHGVGMDSWENKSSNELFQYVTSGSRGWAKYYSDSGDIFVRMGNLDHGTISLDLTDIQYVSLPEKAEGIRSKLQKNDILISITADIGMVGLVGDLPYDAYINQHIALARPTGDDLAEFIAWYLVSDVGLRQMQKKKRGSTKIGLGLDDIRTLQLSIPTQPEQQEIVRILDSLLAKDQQAKEAAEAVLEQIDLTQKSILSRAFRGELGTNDPTEESSIALIKQLLSENLPTEKKPRQKRKAVTKTVAKTILEVLADSGQMTPEQVKAETGLEIDDFYEELKQMINQGTVVESRINGESYLEATHES